MDFACTRPRLYKKFNPKNAPGIWKVKISQPTKTPDELSRFNIAFKLWDNFALEDCSCRPTISPIEF